MKQFIYRINGQDYIVAVNKLENSTAEVAVNGSNYSVELVNEEAELSVASRPAAKVAAPTAAKPAAASAPSPAKAGGSSAGAVKSPLPGIIVAINANVGDTVKKGQTIAVLEAMKMENSIQAPKDGTVSAIHVNVGDSVLEGVSILSID